MKRILCSAWRWPWPAGVPSPRPPRPGCGRPSTTKRRGRSLVRILESGGTLGGKRREDRSTRAKPDGEVRQVHRRAQGQAGHGMAIVEGGKKNADETYWDGGTILDPNNGKTYKVRLTPKDGGKTLEVRGYIGPFYRNQTWQRVE